MLENQEAKNNNEAWEYTLRASTEPPLYGSTIMDRFAQSSTAKPITLFVPWGVSPTRTTANNYDQAALNRVKRYSDQLARYYGAPNAVLIMPADVYAIAINGDDPDRVTQYFSAVGDAANNLGFSVQPWSAIREQNLNFYEEILQWECSPDALFRSTPKALWYDGLFPASLSRNSARSSIA